MLSRRRRLCGSRPHLWTVQTCCCARVVYTLAICQTCPTYSCLNNLEMEESVLIRASLLCWKNGLWGSERKIHRRNMLAIVSQMPTRSLINPCRQMLCERVLVGSFERMVWWINLKRKTNVNQTKPTTICKPQSHAVFACCFFCLRQFPSELTLAYTVFTRGHGISSKYSGFSCFLKPTHLPAGRFPH